MSKVKRRKLKMSHGEMSKKQISIDKNVEQEIYRSVKRSKYKNVYLLKRRNDTKYCLVNDKGFNIFILFIEFIQGGPKVTHQRKKSNISAMARANGLIFLPLIEACSHSISIQTRLERPFVKYHYCLQPKKFYFFTDKKKN
jgi:hypothetical protein